MEFQHASTSDYRGLGMYMVAKGEVGGFFEHDSRSLWTEEKHV
jgi:hypothetical protein